MCGMKHPRHLAGARIALVGAIEEHRPAKEGLAIPQGRVRAPCGYLAQKSNEEIYGRWQEGNFAG